MSNDLKIKDINNKLKIKLETSTWSEFLVSYVEGTAHYNFMDHLLSQLSNGVKFQPPLKNWFTEFFRVDFNKVKLIVVSAEQSVPFLIDDETFHLVTNRTHSDESTTDHGMYWNIFNEVFFEFLEENSKKVPVIFINPTTYPYAKKLHKESKKFFLPESSSTFWQDEENLKNVFKNANLIIKSQGNSELIS